MAQPDTRAGEAERIRERLARLDAERAELEQRLAELACARLPVPEIARHRGQIANRSPTRDKIALFRSLFAGREDVYPRRWENVGKGKAGYAPVCANEWQRGVCHKPRVRCGACPNQAFVPITDEAVEGHLRGRHTLGVYPMLADDTCRFLAADFDKETWRRDARAYLAACRAKGVPAALERSRSGNGAHVWFFFEEPVAASLARRLGAHILTEAMERNPDIGFRSYDRFFPSQDTLPQGGFGNLIALPLQGGPRESGNSVFLDADFEPWPDQWSFLSGLRRLSATELATIVDEAGRQGRIVGLRLPLDDEDDEPWTALPRGCLPAMYGLLEELGIGLDLRDERYAGRPVATTFLGELTPEQAAAADALLAHDTGVLAATTAFGKTVVAASLLADRGTNTLILVHRRQLMDQWIGRLGAFLDLTDSDIGRIGGGKRKPTGVVDVAVIQSLVHGDEVDDIVAEYGHLIVDECHHLSAPSFEKAARRAKVKYVLGLSATVTRQDGHHPIVFMQCGPVRFRANAKAQALRRPFSHQALLRPTAFRLPAGIEPERPPIQHVYAALAEDAARNDMIFDDVLSALEAGRSPLVLTARKDHAERLAERLGRFARNVLFLRGGMGVKQRRAVMRRLEEIPDTEERVLVATGRYIGEGFDDARLDTLFLAMPVAWRGTLAQYVGRLHRLHPAKREVLVYDYADEAVPTLRRMTQKRIRGYRNLGYSVEQPGAENAM